VKYIKCVIIGTGCDVRYTQYFGKLKVLGKYRLETAEGAIKHGQSPIRNTKTTKTKNTTQYVLDNTIRKQTNNVNRT